MLVMIKLIIRAARALSFPLATETRMDRNMNNALTSSAKPTLRDITLKFISLLRFCVQLFPQGVHPGAHLLVLPDKLRDAGIQFRQFIVTLEGIGVFLIV